MAVEPFPNHRGRRRWQAPIGRARRHMQTFQIVILMTCAALYSERAISIRAAAHLHRVPVTIVSLPRKVARRMAIHAARVMEDGDDRFESGGSGSVVAFLIAPFVALCGEVKKQATDQAEHYSSTGHDRREFPPCDSWAFSP